MASNLDCVGLGVSDEPGFSALVRTAMADGVPLGERDGVTVVRWQDPGGARLVLGLRDGSVVDLVPAFAGRPGALLSQVHLVNDEVATAGVDDESGEQVTAMAVEIEQRLLLPREPVACAASVVALGVEVSVHADAAAFGASDASLLGGTASDDDSGDEEAGIDVEGSTGDDAGDDTGALPRGPLRFGAESFISYGVFGDPAQASAHAMLCGTVLSAATHRTERTGQTFHVARVRTAGFEADVCLSAAEHPEPPRPGQVVAGTVFLVADLAWAPPVPAPRRGWFRR